VVEEAKCAACLTCVRICPYDVPKIIGDKAYMDPAGCQSCGFCASECPAKAIEVGLTKEQLIEAQTGIGALEANRAPSGSAAIGFICQFGHVWGADRTYDVTLPDNVRLVPVLCPGRLEPVDILRAFEQGARRVFVSTCDGNYCHYGSGNGLTDRRLDYLRSILDEVGIGADKLVSFKINHETKLSDIVKEMGQ
jgi:formate dehydrogenase (NADP+) beta subunit